MKKVICVLHVDLGQQTHFVTRHQLPHLLLTSLSRSPFPLHLRPRPSLLDRSNRSLVPLIYRMNSHRPLFLRTTHRRRVSTRVMVSCRMCRMERTYLILQRPHKSYKPIRGASSRLPLVERSTTGSNGFMISSQKTAVLSISTFGVVSVPVSTSRPLI